MGSSSWSLRIWGGPFTSKIQGQGQASKLPVHVLFSTASRDRRSPTILKSCLDCLVSNLHNSAAYQKSLCSSQAHCKPYLNLILQVPINLNPDSSAISPPLSKLKLKLKLKLELELKAQAPRTPGATFSVALKSGVTVASPMMGDG